MNIPSIKLVTVSGVPHEEMITYYRAADLLLLTSKSEGSPVITKEALACNLKVVSVDVGDSREQLEGVNGSLICLARADDLGKGILRALQDKSAPNGREMGKKYRKEAVAEQVIEIYQMVAQ